MQKMYNIGKYFTLLLIMAVLFMGIAYASSENNITLWHSLPLENSRLFEEIMNKYVAETNGLITLNVVRFDSMDDLHQKLLEGGALPDIALIDTEWQKALNEKHNVVFAEDLILENVGKTVFIVFKMDTFKEMWEASKQNGKLLTLPFTGFNQALLIDEEVYKENNCKIYPKKWGDLVKIHKQINSNGNERIWTFAFPDYDDPELLAGFFQLLVWQMDSDVFEIFQDGELACFDSNQGRAALQTMHNMINKDKTSIEEDSTDGKMALSIGTPADYIEAVQMGKSVKVLKMPGHSKSANDLTVYSFMIFNKNNKRKLSKIWYLLYEACEFESALKWSLATKYLPNNHQVTRSPKYFVHMNQYPGLKIFIQQLKNAKVSELDEQKQKSMQILGMNIRRALENQMDIETALSESVNSANLIMDPKGDLRNKRAEMKAVNKFVKEAWSQDR
ncbi:MAG: extracellular solute-binding protein [Vulcanimicrobiota bacterium]